MQLPEPCRISGKSDTEALAFWGLIAFAIVLALAVLIALFTGGSYTAPEF